MLMILPGVVQEIADVIGSEAALYLVGRLPVNKHKDGTTRPMLYVPKRLRADHRLVEILGMEKAQKLVQQFPGAVLYPANCREVYVRFRDREILRMHNQGMATREIADIIEVGERTVRNLVRPNANDA